MNISDLPLLSADDITGAVPYSAAIDALEKALRADVDPAADPARTSVEMGAGHLLMMPSYAGEFAGVKLASVAPDNPARGLPRIQAVYVLIEAATMSPLALVDGTALTTIRTPAVSAVAARTLAPRHLRHLVVFGSGPQAQGHIEALAAGHDIDRVTVVGRDPRRAAALVGHTGGIGIPAVVGDPDAVREADAIVCATTAETPLFDGAMVGDDATVLAVGSHRPEHRELDASLMGRSTVVVEDRATALREAGDVVLAIADGALDAERLLPMRDLVRDDRGRDADRPAVFKGTGMSWQDLVVASAAYRALR